MDLVLDLLPNEIISYIISWLPGYQSFGTLYGTRLYNYHKNADPKCMLFAVTHNIDRDYFMNNVPHKWLIKYLLVARPDRILVSVCEIIDKDPKLFLDYRRKCYKNNSTPYIDGPEEYDSLEDHLTYSLLTHINKNDIKLLSGNMDIFFQLLLHVIPNANFRQYKYDNLEYIDENIFYDFISEVSFSDDFIKEMYTNCKYSWLGIIFNGNKIWRHIDASKKNRYCRTMFDQRDLGESQIKYIMSVPYYVYRYLLNNYTTINESIKNRLVACLEDHPKYMYDILRYHDKLTPELTRSYITMCPKIIVKHMKLHIGTYHSDYIKDIFHEHPKYAYKIILDDIKDDFVRKVDHKWYGRYYNESWHSNYLEYILFDQYYTFKYIDYVVKSKHSIGYYLNDESLIRTVISWNDPNYILAIAGCDDAVVTEEMISILKSSDIVWNRYQEILAERKRIMEEKKCKNTNAVDDDSDDE